jgi:hypothetical protein
VLFSCSRLLVDTAHTQVLLYEYAVQHAGCGVKFLRGCSCCWPCECPVCSAMAWAVLHAVAAVSPLRDAHSTGQRPLCRPLVPSVLGCQTRSLPCLLCLGLPLLWGYRAASPLLWGVTDMCGVLGTVMKKLYTRTTPGLVGCQHCTSLGQLGRCLHCDRQGCVPRQQVLINRARDDAHTSLLGVTAIQLKQGTATPQQSAFVCRRCCRCLT